MKFGVISHESKPLVLDGRDYHNMGDFLQTIAMEKILKEFDFVEQIEYVSIYEVSSWKSDEYIILLFNCFNELIHFFHTPGRKFPPSSYLIPVYFGFHLHSTVLPHDIKQHLINFQPIGCRDEETMLNMRNNNILAYLSGCVTALLDKRTKVPVKPKILFIDTPASLEPYVPEKYRENIEYISHIYKITRVTGEKVLHQDEARDIYNTMKRLMDYYKDEATLVVTSRLHAASPCMAMGIPVILVKDNFDGRFSWIDKYLTLYTPDRFSEIDWNPEAVDYEEDKIFMKEVLKECLLNTYEKYKMYRLSEYWEDRKRGDYNKKIFENIKILPFIGRKIKYMLWGSTHFASYLYRIIVKHYREWELVGVIDKECFNEFEGYEICKPEIIDELPDEVIYFVTPDSALKEISNILEEKNKYYVCINPNNFFYSKNCNDLK